MHEAKSVSQLVYRRQLMGSSYAGTMMPPAPNKKLTKCIIAHSTPPPPPFTPQVGTKVRVVGAELVSGRAAEPLDAARTALIKLSFNGVSPVPWDTKLGPAAAGETLR
jgi:hypothetical protein